MFLIVDPSDIKTPNAAFKHLENQFFPWLIGITLVITIGFLIWRFILKDFFKP